VTQVRSSRSEAGFGQKSSNARAGLVDYIPFCFNPAVMGQAQQARFQAFFCHAAGCPRRVAAQPPDGQLQLADCFLGVGDPPK
jgi:hypothetical protein